MTDIQTVVVQTYNLPPIVENKKIVHYLKEPVKEVMRPIEWRHTDQLGGESTFEIFSLDEYLEANYTELANLYLNPGICLNIALE